MGTVHRTAVSLGFYGDDLDPTELTSRLGAAPTISMRKGEHWTTSLGAKKLARTGSWRIEAERVSPGDLDEQIAGLLAPLCNDFDSWKDLSRRFRGRLFCGLFLEGGNEGISLAPETIAMIAERGLLLDLDIYAPESSD